MMAGGKELEQFGAECGEVSLAGTKRELAH